MEHEIRWSLAPADPATFTGGAYSKMIVAAEAEAQVKIFYVRFDPRARTNWHVHSAPQILVVTAGRCRYQIEGDAIRVLQAGQSVRFAPGVRHWHGGTENEGADHIAINLDGAVTTWMEPVE
jgi:quercetin dioxygenase-like cupin family protein